jgi:hypothetical protein
MPHFYERNIIEIRNEYQTFLIKILTPLIYEGILSIYNDSQNYHKDLKEKSKKDPKIIISSTMKIFQLFLKNTPSWNKHIITEETNRIKEKCKCSEWFDDLIKAVIKSNIVLLTFNISGKESNLINRKLHETIQPVDFIHKCYIECAREIYNFPELFFDKYQPIEIKRNQREAFTIIKESINGAIRKLLPMKLILTEFLNNEYTKIDQKIGTDIPDSVYKNIKSLLRKDFRNDNLSFNSSDSYNSNYTTSTSSSDSTSVNKSSDLDFLKDKLSTLIKKDNNDKSKELFFKNNDNNISNKIEIINKDNINDFNKSDNSNNTNNLINSIHNDIKKKNSPDKKIVNTNNNIINNDFKLDKKSFKKNLTGELDRYINNANFGLKKIDENKIKNNKINNSDQSNYFKTYLK